MKNSYRVVEPNEASIELAKKITALIITSAVTYKEAMDALDATENMLTDETRPVKT